jgi:glycosyltransferase involved in cell wall biosynthesis
MGGIHNIIQPLKSCKQKFLTNGIDISFFNTERISRKNDSASQIKIENLINACKIVKDCSFEIDNKNYDVIIYTSSVGFALLKDLLIARYLKQKHKVRVIFQIHSANINKIMPQKFFLGEIIFSQLIKTCDQCIFLSERLLQRFIERGFPKEKAYLLYNYHKMELPEELMKAKLSSKNDSKKIRLIFIGSFDRQKGLLDLFRSLETIDESLYSLDLCGGYNNNDRELRLILEKHCSQFKQSTVNHGYVTGGKKKDMFLNADVCILPSYGEGLPVVLLEAMAAGCAIVTTDVGAITEVIKDRTNGIIISAGDVTALRSAIISLINDNALLKSMQNANYKESANYKIDNYINQLSGILHAGRSLDSAKQRVADI